MATLVLTTVGSMLGGPIGGALGAALGQAIDRTVLFPPKPRSGPRLTDLAVQTSTYGAQIPKVFGVARIAGVVIWSTDLIETRSKNRGGKGQPSTTTYSYAASFAVALSARPVQAVRRIWADGRLLRGAAGDWKTATGFRLHRGDEAQAVDPLIASAVGAAPAHRGVAYAVFENMPLADFGNRIPSLTFEVVGDDGPVRVGRIAREIGGGAMTGEGPDAAVDGLAASGASAAGVLDMLATIAGGWFTAEGGQMHFAAAPGDVMAIDGEVERVRTRRPAETVPLRLSVQHYDPARDYQVGVQQARRGGAGWRDEAVELPVVVSAARAKAIADGALLRREQARETIDLRGDATLLAAAPGRAVTVASLPGVWRVARQSLEGWDVTLSLAVVAPAPLERAADSGVAVGAPDLVAGRTVLEVFELPALDDVLPAAARLLVAAAGTGAGWRRAALLSSADDGASWTAAGDSAAPAVMGVLASPLGWAPSTLEDRRGAVEVMLAHDEMTLETATAAAIDRGANVALIGDELVQFADAVQVAPRRWRLSTLWRGGRGTAPGTHAPGARFVLIEADALAAVTLPAARPGDAVAVIASGAGDGEPVRADAMLTGASIAPPAPVALRAVLLADGARRVTWRRRSRAGWRWRDDGDVPLVEEREEYRVRIATAAGERVLTVGEPAVTVAADATFVAVAQVGTLARSPEAVITIG